MHDQPTPYSRADESPSSLSISHLVHVLRTYLPVIVLSMLVILTAYIVIALVLYLRAPSQHVTSLAFRLEFEGVDRGEYPNGTKFSGSDIVATPLLVKVFDQNNLSRYTSFPEFSRAIYVFEANSAKEALDREYQSRLSDPKLGPIDRERIQREYEAKLNSVSKSQYSISYMHKDGAGGLPPRVATKVLGDILKQWSEFVVKEQRVLEHRVPTLSPDIVTPAVNIDHPLIAAQVLRTKILRLMDNINQLSGLPAAELARTDSDNLSLQDIRLRLDDVLRFRLEPLIHTAATDPTDRDATIRFLETQLAFDQSAMDAQRGVIESAEKTAVLYANRRVRDEVAQPAAGEQRPASSEPKETVISNVNDSFLQRIVELTSNAADANYRRQLAERYRDANLRLVPLQQAVAYDTFLLELVRSGRGEPISREAASQQISALRAEVRTLVVKVHEIYRVLSRNLNPSTQLISVFTPTTTIERTLTLKRLAMFGVLLSLVWLPIIIFLCLLHHRIRREEAEEAIVASESETPPATSDPAAAWPQPASTIESR